MNVGRLRLEEQTCHITHHKNNDVAIHSKHILMMGEIKFV